jgi:subtilisin family serine protease
MLFDRSADVSFAATGRRIGPMRFLTFLAILGAFTFSVASSAAAQRSNSRGPGAQISVRPPVMNPRPPVGTPPSGPRRPPGLRHPPGPIFIPPIEPSPVLADPAVRPRGNPSGPRVRRAQANVPAPNERRYVPDEIVLEVNGSPSRRTVDALARRHRLTRLESQRFAATGTTLFRWRIPDRRSVTTVVRELESDASVRSVQPNYVYTLQQTTTGAATEGDASQYALRKLKLIEAHRVATGEQVLVAVVDSGIDARHPELKGAVADTFDAVGKAGPADPHGTGIAGIIAAHARLMGAAPSVRILAVRAFESEDHGTRGTTFNIVKGLDWAIAHGARIVNMSFAGPRDPMLQRSLAFLKQKGVVLIAAAGNDGPDSPPLFPAADPNVIAVTATDVEDKLFAKANRGSYVALAAPGVDILAPAPDGNYQVASGTSLAAAYVSGVAALLLERRPKLMPDTAKKVLAETAKDLGPRGRDEQFGSGLVDAYQAVSTFDPKTADTAPTH